MISKLSQAHNEVNKFLVDSSDRANYIATKHLTIEITS